MVSLGGDKWSFEYPDLKGILAGGGHHGLELTAGADGQRVTRDMTMNLEHYLAVGLNNMGVFVPRDLASTTTTQINDQTIDITIHPYRSWNLTAKAIFRLLPDRVIKATYEFTFNEAFGNFEVLASNYFPSNQEPWVSLGRQWVRPQIAENRHRFWAKGPAEAALVTDGRWDWIQTRVADMTMIADPRYFDHPIMITATSDPAWYVVNMFDVAGLSSLSANLRWSAHDFNLVGKNVVAGKKVTIRAWLAYTRLTSFNDTLALLSALAK